MLTALLRCSLVSLASCILLTGCGQKNFDQPSPRQLQAAAPGSPMPAPPQRARGDFQAAEQPGNETLRRYRAVSHYMAIEIDADRLEAAWKNAQDFCAVKLAAKCEVLESSLRRSDRETLPSAELKIRIAPDASQAFRAGVQEGGRLVQDRTESLDKTDAVVDTEARLKNMVALRDRLRAMLGASGAKLKDLIELERELARVQSDIDSLTGMRKALANETEKVFIRAEFRSRRSIAESGVLAPISEAFSEVGRIFTESVSALIRFIAAAIPWLVMAPLAVWLVRKLWRRVRTKQNAS